MFVIFIVVTFVELLTLEIFCVCVGMCGVCVCVGFVCVCVCDYLWLCVWVVWVCVSDFLCLCCLCVVGGVCVCVGVCVFLI